MKQKLNILFLCSWYPNKFTPTTGSFIQRHAEAVSLKHNVSVIHIISHRYASLKTEITQQKSGNITTYIAYAKKTNNPLLKFIRFVKIYKKILHEDIKQVDLIHLNVLFPFGILALYSKLFKKIPYIASEHWNGYKPPLSQDIGFFEKTITKIISKHTSFICPVSENLKKAMFDFGLKGNYITVPNVVDTKVFMPSKNNTKKFTITHISSLRNDHKNIKGILHTIADVKKKTPDLVFNLVGRNDENPLPSDQKSLSILKEINVIDHLPHSEMASVLKNSDLFILFSNYENLPCVILEAFSCGVPVVSTNVGGISEYFPSNFGFLIDVKDKVSFEKAILKIYNSELKFSKEEMHQYAIENFGQEAICNSFTKIYLKSLNRQHT